MPWVNIEYARALRLSPTDSYTGPHPVDVREKLKKLANDLPELIVGALNELHLDPSTVEAGVRVQLHRRSAPHDPDGEYVVNGEDLWFRIYLSEAMNLESGRTEQKYHFRAMIEQWFQDHCIELPQNTMFVFIPGPTYGCGFVNGESIDW